MPRRSQWIACLTRSMIFVLALWLFCTGNGYAQHVGGPFERMVGQWAGSGTIDLSNGTREPIKCRASYDLPTDQHRLQLNIRCASDSYNFDLSGQFTADEKNQITGRWTERIRNVGGTAIGNAQGERLQIHTESSAFSADLVIVTRNRRQSVTIDSQGGGQIVKASITLSRM